MQVRSEHCLLRIAGTTSSNVVPSTDPLRSAVAAASGLVVADTVASDEQAGGLMTASFDVI